MRCVAMHGRVARVKCMFCNQDGANARGYHKECDAESASRRDGHLCAFCGERERAATAACSVCKAAGPVFTGYPGGSA